MALRHMSLIAVLACWCILTAGCDPVRTTLQPVHLKVTNSISGEPVQDVQVSLKWDYELNVPIAKQRPKAQRPTDSWFSGKTDVNGEADVGIKWTALDTTWGSTPPASRDWVTGQVYRVRAWRDDALEEHSLRVRPGESVRGKAFTVHVQEIQRPRYVKTGQ